MKTTFALTLMLALTGCGRDDSWCPGFAASVDLNDFVNESTGRIDYDPQLGVVYYPRTGHVALTREEVQCIRREAEGAVNALEAGR